MDVKLPGDVCMGPLLGNRVQEISKLSEMLTVEYSKKIVGQKVPRHMRRRAVAHDVRRLPRRLRDTYMKQKASGGGNVPASKRPSRKHRRRAGNLLSEYNRRQKNQFWLETHIWHAKRFHMYYKWGYKIPGFPNDKCWRACYRATKSTCLMFDVSYMNTIEIKGKESVIINGLNKLTCTETWLDFNKGTGRCLEQTALIFFPPDLENNKGSSQKLIGEVSYLWLSNDNVAWGVDDVIRIWISCHPAFVKDLWKALATVFQLEKLDDIPDLNGSSMDVDKPDNETDKENKDESINGTEIEEPPAKKQKPDEDSKSKPKPPKDIEKEKLAPRNVPFERTPKYTGLKGVEVTDLQGVINRFRLVGPRSLDLVRTSCVPSQVQFQDGNQEPAADGCDEEKVEDKLYWWKKHFSIKQNFHDFEFAYTLWASADLSANCSLVVRDPRLLLPIKKRIKPAPVSNSDKKRAPHPGGPGQDFKSWKRSPFFDHHIRDSVTLSKAPDMRINKKRSEQPIPGLSIPLDGEESRIPIMILPDRKYQTLDLLIPAGWAMPFWMCLVYNGCRVGGDKELQHLTLEEGRPPVLLRYPESTAGSLEAKEREEKSRQDFFSHPPNHRVNFGKLGIASPFCAPWELLLKDWRSSDSTDTGSTEITVLRNRKLLDALERGEDVFDQVGNQDCLVAVKLSISSRGKLTHNSIICLPTREDIAEVTECGEWEGPVDSLQKDVLEKERSDTVISHKAMKKRLKRRWKKLKDKKVLMKCQSSALGKELDQEKMNQLNSGMDTLKQMREVENAQFGAKNEKLWVAECKALRNSCKREVMGLVTEGDMSYRLGCHVGYGFVTLRALRKWRQEIGENPRKLVLTRETTSLQYRFSVLQIL